MKLLNQRVYFEQHISRLCLLKSCICLFPEGSENTCLVGKFFKNFYYVAHLISFQNDLWLFEHSSLWFLTTAALRLPSPSSPPQTALGKDWTASVSKLSPAFLSLGCRQRRSKGFPSWNRWRPWHHWLPDHWPCPVGGVGWGPAVWPLHSWGTVRSQIRKNAVSISLLHSAKVLEEKKRNGIQISNATNRTQVNFAVRLSYLELHLP